MVDEKVVATGRGRSKKAAEQEAARLALDDVEAVEEDA
jgi:dsRNA-specific ribonuclease